MRSFTLAAMTSFEVCGLAAEGREARLLVGLLLVSFAVVWMLMVWFSPFLNGCAVFVPKHALALAHASRGGKCKERGISHPEHRRGQPKAGLHKRSAEDWGYSLRAPGTESLRRLGFLGVARSARLIVLWEGVAGRNGPLRRVPEDGGFDRRLEAGRNRPPRKCTCWDRRCHAAIEMYTSIPV